MPADTQPRSDKPTGRGAAAGGLLVMSIVLCALVGLALGALVGGMAILTVLGGFAGIAVGFWLVRRQFGGI